MERKINKFDLETDQIYRILHYLTKANKIESATNILFNKLMEMINPTKIEINKFFEMCLKANIIKNKYANLLESDILKRLNRIIL
jgi:hypothetical protein